MSETLVTIQLRFEDVDRALVAERIGPVVEAAICAGGESTSVSVQRRQVPRLSAEEELMRAAMGAKP